MKKIFRVIVLFIVLCLIIYVSFLLIENYKFDKKHNFDIKIVDETDTCIDTLEKFYEDEYHNYYFSCIKSDNVYAIIKGEKYLVKDLLNDNPTDYVINIKRLETAGLSFMIEDKYKSFEVIYKDYGSLNIDFDSSLIDIVNYESINDNNNTVEKFYVIPKNGGKTFIKVSYDDTYDIYDVVIDNDVSLMKR